MGIIDIVFLAVLAIGFISGLQKGLITSALSLVAILGASIIAGSLENMLASRLVNADLYIDWVNTSLKPETMNPEQWQAVWNNICHVISFTIVFLIAWAALQLLVNLLNNVFRLFHAAIASSPVLNAFVLLKHSMHCTNWSSALNTRSSAFPPQNGHRFKSMLQPPICG